MEEDNVLLTLPENIKEVRKQGMTSSMKDGVVQDTNMCEFSRNIEPNCKDFVSSKQIVKRVKNVDHEVKIKECSYSPQHDKGFKMKDSLNEEFIRDGCFKKPYKIEQLGVSDKEHVVSPETVLNRISVKTELDNENFVSPPQPFDELIKMKEHEATSAEFVNSPQIVEPFIDQSVKTSETLVNWPQPLQSITKVNHGLQGDTVTMKPRLSAMADLGSESPYTCSICGKVFKTQAVMTLHNTQFHNTKLIFKCNVCGKAFLKRSSLNKHNLTHVEKCGICGKKFNGLSLHMLNHTGERPHRCWVCGKVFIATANSNAGSSNLISTNKNRFYDCDICGKEITGWNYFTLHMKKHTLRQTDLTCVCSKTPGSSSDTKNIVTSTQEGSLNFGKTCINIKHNEEQCTVDVNDNQNTCSFCEHQFQSQFELHLHLLTHFNGRVQDCSVCVHGFRSQELLLKHLINHIESSMYDSCAYVTGVQKKKQSVILDKEKWGTSVNYSSKQGLSQNTAVDTSYEQLDVCDVWQKGITTKSNITEHMSSHTGQFPYKCDVCLKGFTRKVDLGRHVLTHTGERPHKCGVCGNGFRQKAALTNHMFTHTGECPHKCEVCGKGFIQKGSLMRHMLTHTGELPHKCGVCGKGFKEKGTLTSHILTHTGERPHKCGICGKGCIQKTHLKYHILTHTGERPHTCGVCGKGFTAITGLKYHILTHTGELPHKCDVCRKGFKSTNTLTNHSFTHTGLYPHHCAVCNKGFVQKSVLSKHMLTHTGNVPYKCCVCGQGFKQKSEITGHMVTHTGDWSYKCGVCRKRCTTKRSLKKHLSAHRTIYPYECSMCQKGYIQKGSLRTHILTHTRK